jgi:hypothetical protein
VVRQPDTPLEQSQSCGILGKPPQRQRQRCPQLREESREAAPGTACSRALLVSVFFFCSPAALSGSFVSAGFNDSTTSNRTAGLVYPVGGPSVWGRCVGYSVHGAATVSFAGSTTTIQTGSVGVAPGTDLTGSWVVVDGASDLNNSPAIACAADKKGAYNFLRGLTCPALNKLNSSDLADRILLPGVYCFESMLLSAATLTLDGNNDTLSEWVFQTSTTLETTTATSMILINGAQASNVYWAVGSSATLAHDSSFIGQITAYASITVNTRCSLRGRALAGVSVTFSSSGSVTLPDGANGPSNTNTSTTNSSSSSSTGGSGQSSSTGPASSSTAVASSSSGMSSSSGRSSSSSTGISSSSTGQSSTGSSSSSAAVSSSSSSSSGPHAVSSSSSSSSSATGSSSVGGDSGSSGDSSSASSTGGDAAYNRTVGPPTAPVGGSSIWSRCLGYAAHGATAVNFNGPTTTIQTGSVGVAPGVAITGSFIVVDGSTDRNNAAALACAADKTGIYEFLHGLTCPASHLLDSADLAGRTLLPGVWCFESMVLSAATLTLDGAGDPNAEWVFQTATSLVTATATSFILINGAQASNVYWAIGSSATLSYDSSFVGQITAAVSITVGSSCNLLGRALAGAAVTFAGGAMVTLPVYQVAVATPLPASLCDALTVRLGGDASSVSQEMSALKQLILRALIGVTVPASEQTGSGTTVTGIFSHPLTRSFFDGSVNTRYLGSPQNDVPAGSGSTSPDFRLLANETGLQTTCRQSLTDHLVELLGGVNAMNCTAVGYPVYTRTNQLAVHRDMVITASIFAAFNSEIVSAADSFQLLDDASRTKLRAYLSTFGRTSLPLGESVICNQEDCPCGNGSAESDCAVTTSPATVQSAMSAYVLLFTVAITLFMAIGA